MVNKSLPFQDVYKRQAYMRKQEQAVKQEKSAFQLAWEAALKK